MHLTLFPLPAQKRSMLSLSPADDDVETLLAQSSAARALGQPPHATGRVGAPNLAASAGGGGRGRWRQRLTLAPQRSAWGRKPAEPPAEEDAALGKLLSGG